jgi:Bacterial Ig domain
MVRRCTRYAWAIRHRRIRIAKVRDPAVGTELYALTHAMPAAVADSAASTNDAAVTIDVLANDTDSDRTLDPASIVFTTSPAHGTGTVNAGKVLYTPSAGFAGTDTFAYTVSDTQGIASAPAIVTIAVTSPPPAGGGGGAMGWLTLWGLAWLRCLRFTMSRGRVLRKE